MISAIATIAVSLATIVYVFLTHKLVKETRETRISQLQPRLIIDIELVSYHFFHLAVRNIGNDLAQNINITCEPILGKLSNTKIESLSPTQDYRQYLMFSDPNKLKDMVITLSGVYENSAGKSFETIRKIDMSVYDTDAINPREYKEITEAITKTGKDLTDKLTSEIKSMNREIASKLNDIVRACSKR
jgi:hypothetical protein